MAKVLVEVDIHVGLLESLEIEWRGHIHVQRLDYLRIHFRCNLCKQPEHLRKDYQQAFGASDAEDSMEDLFNYLYTTWVDS